MYLASLYDLSFSGGIPRPIADIAMKKKIIFSVPKGNLDSALAQYLSNRKDILDPFSVNLDINGDKKLDYFSILNNGNRLKLVAAYSIDTAYNLILIDDLGEDKDICSYLTIIPPGLIRGYSSDGKYTNKDSVSSVNYSVKLNRFRSDNLIVFWKNGSLNSWMFTGD
jgi:hypothetical protein